MESAGGMTTLGQSYASFRYLVRNVRWVELAISCLIVFFARQLSHLTFDPLPVAIVFGLGFLWNLAFWYAGRSVLHAHHRRFQPARRD